MTLASVLISGTGPSSRHTYTFPDANAVILTDHDLVTAAQGGTGFGTYALGDLLYGNGPAMVKLPAVAVGQVLVSAGVGMAPAWSGSPSLSGSLTWTSDGAGNLGDATHRPDVVYAKTNVITTKLASPVGSTLSLWQGATEVLDLNVGTNDIIPGSDATFALGRSNFRFTSGIFSTALIVGTNPASAGGFRAASGFTFMARNNANSGDRQILGIDSSDRVVIGDALGNILSNSTFFQFGGTSSAFPALRRTSARLDFRLADDSAYGSVAGNDANFSTFTGPGTPATAGVWRLANAAGVNWRNTSNTLDYGITLNGSDNFIVGASGVNFYPSGDNNQLLGGASNRWQYVHVGTAVAVGTNPSLTGGIRMGNDTFIIARRADNAADERIIGKNAGNQVEIGGSSRDIMWGKPLVALGGGAAPTFGTIGGSGPAVAAQNTWMQILDTTGALFWVPAWK